MPAALQRVGGEGPPVVLIHGFGADRMGWVANTPALMEHFSTWTVELPAHGTAEPGGTTLDELAAAVAACLPDGTVPVALVGHSLGGAVAARLAQSHAGRVGKVALLAPAGFGAGTPDPAFLRGLPRLESEADALALLSTLVVRQRLIQPPMAQHVLAHLRKPGRRIALAAIAEAALSFTPPPLPPDALVIWGEDDAINPVDARWLAGLGDRCLLLPQTGHLPHVEAATRVNRALAAYLSS